MPETGKPSDAVMNESAEATVVQEVPEREMKTMFVAERKAVVFPDGTTREYNLESAFSDDDYNVHIRNLRIDDITCSEVVLDEYGHIKTADLSTPELDALAERLAADPTNARLIDEFNELTDEVNARFYGSDEFRDLTEGLDNLHSEVMMPERFRLDPESIASRPLDGQGGYSSSSLERYLDAHMTDKGERYLSSSGVMNAPREGERFIPRFNGETGNIEMEIVTENGQVATMIMDRDGEISLSNIRGATMFSEESAARLEEMQGRLDELRTAAYDGDPLGSVKDHGRHLRGNLADKDLLDEYDQLMAESRAIMNPDPSVNPYVLDAEESIENSAIYRKAAEELQDAQSSSVWRENRQAYDQIWNEKLKDEVYHGSSEGMPTDIPEEMDAAEMDISPEPEPEMMHSSPIQDAAGETGSISDILESEDEGIEEIKDAVKDKAEEMLEPDEVAPGTDVPPEADNGMEAIEIEDMEPSADKTSPKKAAETMAFGSGNADEGGAVADAISGTDRGESLAAEAEAEGLADFASPDNGRDLESITGSRVTINGDEISIQDVSIGKNGGVRIDRQTINLSTGESVTSVERTVYGSGNKQITTQKGRIADEFLNDDGTVNTDKLLDEGFSEERSEAIREAYENDGVFERESRLYEDGTRYTSEMHTGEQSFEYPDGSSHTLMADGQEYINGERIGMPNDMASPSDLMEDMADAPEMPDMKPVDAGISAAVPEGMEGMDIASEAAETIPGGHAASVDPGIDFTSNDVIYSERIRTPDGMQGYINVHADGEISAGGITIDGKDSGYGLDKLEGLKARSEAIEAFRDDTAVSGRIEQLTDQYAELRRDLGDPTFGLEEGINEIEIPGDGGITRSAFNPFGPANESFYKHNFELGEAGGESLWHEDIVTRSGLNGRVSMMPNGSIKTDYWVKSGEDILSASRIDTISYGPTGDQMTMHTHFEGPAELRADLNGFAESSRVMESKNLMRYNYDGFKALTGNAELPDEEFGEFLETDQGEQAFEQFNDFLGGDGDAIEMATPFHATPDFSYVDSDGIGGDISDAIGDLLDSPAVKLVLIIAGIAVAGYLIKRHMDKKNRNVTFHSPTSSRDRIRSREQARSEQPKSKGGKAKRSEEDIAKEYRTGAANNASIRTGKLREEREAEAQANAKQAEKTTEPAKSHETEDRTNTDTSEKTAQDAEKNADEISLGDGVTITKDSIYATEKDKEAEAKRREEAEANAKDAEFEEIPVSGNEEKEIKAEGMEKHEMPAEEMADHETTPDEAERTDASELTDSSSPEEEKEILQEAEDRKAEANESPEITAESAEKTMDADSHEDVQKDSPFPDAADTGSSGKDENEDDRENLHDSNPDIIKDANDATEVDYEVIETRDAEPDEKEHEETIGNAASGYDVHDSNRDDRSNADTGRERETDPLRPDMRDISPKEITPTFSLDKENGVIIFHGYVSREDVENAIDAARATGMVFDSIILDEDVKGVTADAFITADSKAEASWIDIQNLLIKDGSFEIIGGENLPRSPFADLKNLTVANIEKNVPTLTNENGEKEPLALFPDGKVAVIALTDVEKVPDYAFSRANNGVTLSVNTKAGIVTDFGDGAFKTGFALYAEKEDSAYAMRERDIPPVNAAITSGANHVEASKKLYQYSRKMDYEKARQGISNSEQARLFYNELRKVYDNREKYGKYVEKWIESNPQKVEEFRKTPEGMEVLRRQRARIAGAVLSDKGFQERAKKLGVTITEDGRLDLSGLSENEALAAKKELDSYKEHGFLETKDYERTLSEYRRELNAALEKSMRSEILADIGNSPSFMAEIRQLAAKDQAVKKEGSRTMESVREMARVYDTFNLFDTVNQDKIRDANSRGCVYTDIENIDQSHFGNEAMMNRHVMFADTPESNKMKEEFSRRLKGYWNHLRLGGLTIDDMTRIDALASGNIKNLDNIRKTLGSGLKNRLDDIPKGEEVLKNYIADMRSYRALEEGSAMIVSDNTDHGDHCMTNTGITAVLQSSHTRDREAREGLARDRRDLVDERNRLMAERRDREMKGEKIPEDMDKSIKSLGKRIEGIDKTLESLPPITNARFGDEAFSWNSVGVNGVDMSAETDIKNLFSENSKKNILHTTSRRNAPRDPMKRNEKDRAWAPETAGVVDELSDHEDHPKLKAFTQKQKENIGFYLKFIGSSIRNHKRITIKRSLFNLLALPVVFAVCSATKMPRRIKKIMPKGVKKKIAILDDDRRGKDTREDQAERYADMKKILENADAIRIHVDDTGRVNLEPADANSKEAKDFERELREYIMKERGDFNDDFDKKLDETSRRLGEYIEINRRKLEKFEQTGQKGTWASENIEYAISLRDRIDEYRKDPEKANDPIIKDCLRRDTELFEEQYEKSIQNSQKKEQKKTRAKDGMDSNEASNEFDAYREKAGRDSSKSSPSPKRSGKTETSRAKASEKSHKKESSMSIGGR